MNSLLDESNNEIKDNLIYRLNYSANLVQRFGEYKFDNGVTIRDILTIDEISYWDLFTAELSHFHIPQIFLSKKGFRSKLDLIKPDLIRLKYSVAQTIKNRFYSNGCDKLMNNQSVAFLGFTNRMYIDILHPLISDFETIESISPVVFMDAHLPARKDFNLNNCNYQSIWRYSDKKSKLQVRLIRKKIKLKLDQFDIDSFMKNVLLEDDLVFLPNFISLFERVFRAYIPNSVIYILLAKQILQKHRPLIVVSPDTADSRTRVFSLLARNIGIPTLDIQFGLSGDEAVEYRFLLSEKVAVWGNSSKQAIIKQNIEEDRIVITGSPRHDILVNQKDLNLARIKRSLSIPNDSKVILLASTYNFKDKTHVDISILKSMQIAISEAVCDTEKIFLIVKPHPHEDVIETKQYFSKSTKIFFVEKDSDIRNLIMLCDAFISYGSTTTIDALIAEKLTICPIFPGWTFSSDIFRDSGATLNPTTKGEILQIFKLIANGNDQILIKNLARHRELFLKNYIYKNDGNSAKRINKLIISMIPENFKNLNNYEN